jgi:serine/threonine protein phosphatase 1
MIFRRGANQRTYKPEVASVPEGQRVYAVGDIHGMAALLRQLLSKIKSDIEEHPEEDSTLIFLGDYVDRGMDSRGVLDYLVSDNVPAASTFLMGNHEEFLLGFLEEPKLAEDWRHFGGLETLNSYGVDIGDVRRGRGYERARDELLRRIPDQHLRFLQSLLLSTERGDYFFCHAGVRPSVSLARQERSDLLWVRDEFLAFDGPFEKVVVHGHTPCEEVYLGQSRINVDTGAYATGHLSAVCLSGTERQTISTSK